MKCQYCGTNPVPHKIEWYIKSLDIAMAPLRRAIVYSRPGILLQKTGDAISSGLLSGMEKLGAVKYNTDFSKLKVNRAKVLWEEAVARGWSIKEIKPLGLMMDAYKARIPATGSAAARDITFFGLPRQENYGNSALDWADDKWLFKKALIKAGLPAAPGKSVWNYNQALKVFKALRKPVIIKPRMGSRGRHTTTYIYTEAEFKQAYRIAKQLCYWVIVEEHLEGPVWRGTVVDGKCVGMLGGDPPKITGDGKSTIEQLIAGANANKHPEVKDILINKKMHEFLARRGGMTIKTVLPAGQLLYLNEKIGVNYGGSSFEAYEDTHPDILKMFEDAAALINDPILGFDFICEDISKSWRDQRCGIIECNALPFINLHHDPLHGKPRNVAKYVWDYVQATFPRP